MAKPFGTVPAFGAPGPYDSPVEAFSGNLNQGEGEPLFKRTGPLITVEDIKALYLFGIPLQSALTGETFADKSIEKIIVQAVSDAETSLRIPISPVRVVDKFDYIQCDDAYGFGTKKLTRFPIIKVEALRACFPGYDPSQVASYIDFPTNWATPLGDTGLIRIVPISGSLVDANVNFINAVGAWVTYMNALTYWPNMWTLQYIAGFDQDQIPEIVNDLIGHLTSIRILSTLGPLIFPANGYSVAMSGMSQSTSTMGPAFLAQRIQELTAKKDQLLQQLKEHYCSDILFSTF